MNAIMHDMNNFDFIYCLQDGYEVFNSLPAVMSVIRIDNNITVVVLFINITPCFI